MYTINQLLKASSNFATAHYQVNSYGDGDIQDFAASGVTRYPSMWVDYNTSSVSTNDAGGYTETGFTVYFVDRLLKGGTNLAEVMSDMQKVCIDYIAYCQSPQYFPQSQSILLYGDITLNPIKDSFHDDEIAGFYFDVVFKSSYDINTCQIPQTGLSALPTGSTSTGGSVTILDQDGNTVATVSCGGTYSVLSFDTISGGASNTTYSNNVISS